MRLLGPLRTEAAGGRPVRLAPREACVLAMLAIQPGVEVTRDHFVRGVWGEDHPLTAPNSLQVAVSTVRRKLRAAGVGDLLHTTPSGYVLDPDKVRTDMARVDFLYKASVAAVAQDRPQAAAAALGECLALWRAAPLADIHVPFAATFRTQAEGVFQVMCLEWLDVNIGLGRSQHVVTAARHMADRFPDHQGMRARLIACLHNCGRTSEALQVFHDLRHHLVETLGIDPGRLVERVHEAVLRNELPISVSALDTQGACVAPPLQGWPTRW